MGFVLCSCVRELGKELIQKGGSRIRVPLPVGGLEGLRDRVVIFIESLRYILVQKVHTVGLIEVLVCQGPVLRGARMLSGRVRSGRSYPGKISNCGE
jgi:hypothetical protein